MAHHLFSYGTLQKEKVQLESFGRVLKGQPAVLSRYKLSSLEITNPLVLTKSEQQFHPIAVSTQNEEDKIKGMVFEITEKELEQADDYEVDDYLRVKETLDSGMEAWVYVGKQL